MSKQHTVTVVGTPTGDNECWCLRVSEQEYRKVVGTEMYRRELDYRREIIAEGGKPGPWLIYPNDLIPDRDIQVEIKVKVRRT